MFGACVTRRTASGSYFRMIFLSDYLNIEMADVPSCVVIGFVIPRGKTEVTVTQAMALAYDKSKEAGLSTIWIQEQEMLNTKPTKADVLVLDPFSGPALTM